MRRVLAVVAALVALAVPAAPALAHGGEDEALEKTPARALAQQALALLSQKNKATESHERVEAALKSKDTEGVDLDALRRTQRAFDRGDHAQARELLSAALAPKETAEMGDEEHAEEGQQGSEPGASDLPDETLEHQPEFEPARGTAEWIGFGVGVAALFVASAALLRFRAGRTA